VRMATENAWRARKIQAELSKLGIRVSPAAVSRYVPKPKPDPTEQQRWTTFLRGPAKLAKRLRLRRPRNHKDVISGAITSFEIDPKRTAFRSPWQNGTAERVVGSVRRELPDHVVVSKEDH